MPFVGPKSSAPSSNNNSGGVGGRTTFRPPWVKDDGGSSKANASVKSSVPWAKKTAAAEKENGDKSNMAKNTPSTSKNVSQPAIKKILESQKKINAEPIKKSDQKIVSPVNKLSEPSKKNVETMKKAIPNSTAKTPESKKTKEPMPASSSEEEDETEEEETEEEETEESKDETEEESEDEKKEEADSIEDEEPDLPEEMKRLLRLRPTQTNKKKEEEPSELKQRFTIEKPKLRPVSTGFVKRDKSMKKIEDDEDGEGIDSESEEERKLRFKLEKPKLRHVKREEKPLPSKSSENILKTLPALKKVSKIDEILKEPKEEQKPEFKTKTLRKTPSIKRELNIKNVPAPPPLPSLVPKAPPPPLGGPGEKRPISEAQKQVIQKLKTRPRRRPDWSEMMKEVESGKKLRHVECNDRSQPILTCKSMTKVDNKFIYETEKDNSHNKLLQQIQGGIKLKKTQTNDRSKPILEGLRKFRRQMTIEEQLQKSQSKVNMLGETPGNNAASLAVCPTTAARGSIVSALSIDEGSEDELDDIDKIRDDLQSTKQMLALELRNREAQERENKKLLAKIKTLEAELEREKSREKNLEYGSNVIVATMDPLPTSEQAYVNSLKREVEDARKTAKEVEKNYHDTSELLDQIKTENDEQKRQIQILERKLAQALQGNMTPSTNRSHISFCFAYDDDFDICKGMDVHHNSHKGGGLLDGSRRASDVHTGRDSSPELEIDLSESDPDEPEEKKIERRERRIGKEVKILRSKLTKLKVKQEAAKKEKDALKQAMKKNHVILKEENKKFKKLEKEVQKMAASLKLDENEDDEENEEVEEPAEEEVVSEEESEEESEESESEESDAETESDSEAEDSSNANKKQNLEPRVKKHESRLSAMKKCNVLLQANVDNIQDEITQVRTKAANLQAELNSVLQDLGL